MRNFLVFLFIIFLSGCSLSPYSSHVSNEVSEELNFAKLNQLGPGHGPHNHEISTLQFETVKDIAKRVDDLPLSSNFSGKVVKITLEAKEVVSDIALNTTYMYWTFNETVPGPMLRVREGDVVEMTLKNHKTSTKVHSIDLHAVNGPGGGSVLTQVVPGEEKSFRFKALNPGLYVYHCATTNVPMHIANGMYGLILVEPKEGLSKVDKEFYLMQGEIYTSGKLGEQGMQYFDAKKMLDEDPEYILFNGRANAVVDFPAKVKVGDSIRIFVGNGGVSKISSFHVIGEVFDTVYQEAGSLQNHNVQTTLIPAGGATIVEFTVNSPGKYVIVDHALARLDRGAWGIIEVEGKEQPKIYSKTE